MVLVLSAAVRSRPHPNTALRDDGLYASPFEMAIIDCSSMPDEPCLEQRPSLSVSRHWTAVDSYGLLSVISGVSAIRPADTPVNRYSRPYQTERRTLVLPPVGDDPNVGRDDRQGTCGGVSETSPSLTNCTVSDTEDLFGGLGRAIGDGCRSNSHESTTGSPVTRSLHKLSRRVLGQAMDRSIRGYREKRLSDRRSRVGNRSW